MRKIIGSVFAVAAVCAIVVLVYIAVSAFFEQRRAADGIMPAAQSASVHFIGLCSGYDMSNEDLQLIGTAECLGRVRGFVDGSAVANQIAHSASGNSFSLWCVNPSNGADKVLSAIMDWVDANPNEYAQVVQTAAPNNAATIVIMKALRSSYPCINT